LYTPAAGGDYQTGGSFSGVYNSAMGFGYPTSWNRNGRDDLFSVGNLMNPSSGNTRATGIRSVEYDKSEPESTGSLTLTLSQEMWR
jgi:hypothetical protein